MAAKGDTKWDYDELRWVCITALGNKVSPALVVSSTYGVTEGHARSIISKARRAGYDIPYERRDLQDGTTVAITPHSFDVVFTREDWMADGACRDHDLSLFFPGVNENATAAKAICAGCLVKDECLEYALRRGEQHGVWGGLSHRERRKLRRTVEVAA